MRRKQSNKGKGKGRRRKGRAPLTPLHKVFEIRWVRFKGIGEEEEVVGFGRQWVTMDDLFLLQDTAYGGIYPCLVQTPDGKLSCRVFYPNGEVK